MKSQDSSIHVIRAEGTSRGVYKEGGGGFNGKAPPWNSENRNFFGDFKKVKPPPCSMPVYAPGHKEN